MSNNHKKIRLAVKRDQADNYLLTSLVSFGVTVITTRLFLQLTGYPQIGDSVLHIAHALWGGLLLFIAVLIPLAFANLWAIQVSALLGGIGIGLFIDEVGKFITQTNDYFYPPALSLIYGFFLLSILVYLYFRRSRQENPRAAMYHVLEGLQDALDGDLDQEEAARIEAQLAIAKGSDREEILSLADAINTYLQQEKGHLSAAEPGFWKRIAMGVDAFGLHLGRRVHRTIITIILILWMIFVFGFIAVLVLNVPTIVSQVIQWRGVLISIQVVVGGLIIVALLTWLVGNEERGLRFATSGFLLSMVALQTLYFYLSQFAAITATLLQFFFLLILLACRHWYLGDNRGD